MHNFDGNRSTLSFDGWEKRRVIHFSTPGPIAALPLGIGTIPWSEITGAYIKSIKDNDFICLELQNPEMWTSQLSGIKKAAVSANRALGFTEFSLNLVGAAADATAIHELIIKKIAERSIAKR